MSVTAGSALWFLAQSDSSPPGSVPPALPSNPLVEPKLASGGCVDTFRAVLALRQATTQRAHSESNIPGGTPPPPPASSRRRKGKKRGGVKGLEGHGGSFQAATALPAGWGARRGQVERGGAIGGLGGPGRLGGGMGGEGHTGGGAEQANGAGVTAREQQQSAGLNLGAQDGRVIAPLPAQGARNARLAATLQAPPATSDLGEAATLKANPLPSTLSRDTFFGGGGATTGPSTGSYAEQPRRLRGKSAGQAQAPARGGDDDDVSVSPRIPGHLKGKARAHDHSATPSALGQTAQAATVPGGEGPQGNMSESANCAPDHPGSPASSHAPSGSSSRVPTDSPPLGNSRLTPERSNSIFSTASGPSASPPSAASSSSSQAGDEILVLTRFSTTPPQYRTDWSGLTLEQCINNVQTDVERCVSDGRAAARRTWILEGNEVYLPFLAFGSASKAPSYWRKEQPEAVPREVSGPAFLAKLPNAKLIVIVGHDGVTDVLPALRDEFCALLDGDCQICVTQKQNTGTTLLMTAAELAHGLDKVIRQDEADAGNMAVVDEDDIAPDVLTWLQSLPHGASYREGLGEAAKSRGDERFRRGLKRPLDVPAGPARTVKTTGREPPQWKQQRRCGREDCPYVASPHNVEVHRVGTAGRVCFGRCPGGCDFIEHTSIEDKRNHISTEHPDLRLCPLATCLFASVHRESMRTHALAHADGRLFPSGLAHGNEWLTEARALSRPVHPEPVGSPWPDRSG